MNADYYTYTVMQSAAEATGNGTAVTCYDGSVGALNTLTVHVEGITSATITFEATIDGTNWIAVGLTSLADNSTVATTATADGLYRLNCTGLYKVRARISTYATGTIYVYGVAVA